MAAEKPSCICEIFENSNGNLRISLSGPLTIGTAAPILAELAAIVKKKSFTALTLDLSNINAMDDYGALVLYELKNTILRPGQDFQVQNTPEKIKPVMALAMNPAASKNDFPARLSPSSARANLVAQTGVAAITQLKNITYFIAFIGSLVMAGQHIFRKPKSLRKQDILQHMKTTGVDALPVVALISTLLGLIMAFMSSLQLKQFGANLYVASLVALAMVSELGPIMTAIIVAGRSGSAYAAEISAMKISEEVDALRIMGFDPVLFLVIPRMAAAVVVVPILTMFANLFAICGGLVIGVTMLDLSTTSYISQTFNTLKLFELFWGLSKSFVFAILISGVGCLRGFQAKGGASAVGHAATSAVVSSIFLIVLFDSIFAVIRSYWR